MPTAEVRRGGVEIIDELGSEWHELIKNTRYDEPFYRPEWIGAYVRAFAPRQQVVVVTVRHAGRLVAVLPLVKSIGWFHGLPARKLTSASNVHTCRYDLIHAPDAIDAVLAAWCALRDERDWDVLELTDVPIRGAVAHLARAAQSEGHPVAAVRAATSPFLAWRKADAVDPVLDRAGAKFRSNLRRRMRKLETKGVVRLVQTLAADEQLMRFYELEQSSWKGAESTAIVCNPATRQFYDRVAEEGARSGYLSIYSLECGGRPVAMYYGLNHRGRYSLLKTAYDESLRECSPGQLITHEVLHHLAKHGGNELDFLGEMMDWKRDWAPRLRPHANWYIFRGSMGRLLHISRFMIRPHIARALKHG